jgi:DNA-binding transcriptional MocR family regulator
VINKRRGRAVYLQIADEFRDEILDGTRAEGSTMPSGDMIRRLYDVSMTTAERVLGQLAAEGLIETRTGRPARVRALRVRETLWLEPSMTVTTRMPTAEELADEELDLKPRVPVLVVQQVGEPDRIYPGDRWQAMPAGPPIKRRGPAVDDPIG